MTTVVHCKKAKYDVLIDRTTIFGNPFPISETCHRSTSLAMFTSYFYRRLEKDREFRNAIEALKDKTLGCWCKPKACHGDIIAAYLDGTNDAEW
jgi:hypothetical protein